MNSLANWLVKRWYAASPGALKLLLPLEKLFIFLAQRRRQAYITGKKLSYQSPVPVIIVGNLHVGGSGKSPIVAALAKHLTSLGYKCGIVSRGYGGKAASYPVFVTPNSNASQVGDEPLMLAQQTGLPVAVSPKRPEAAQLLIEKGCNLILADDGLQHYALQRHLELVVLDAQRGWGNNHCLPVGPLREPAQRLAEVDWLLIQQPAINKTAHLDNPAAPPFLTPQLPQVPLKHPPVNYALAVSHWRNLAGAVRENLPFAAGQQVNALAAISQPEKFFAQLESLGLKVSRHPKADHAPLNQQDLNLAANQLPLVITAKDAVKFLPLITAAKLAPAKQEEILANTWVLEVTAQLPPEFLQQLEARLSKL